MLYKLVSVSVFALLAVSVIQLINKSFTHVYKTVETSVQKPYAKAQSIYEQSGSLR